MFLLIAAFEIFRVLEEDLALDVEVVVLVLGPQAPTFPRKYRFQVSWFCPLDVWLLVTIGSFEILIIEFVVWQIFLEIALMVPLSGVMHL